MEALVIYDETGRIWSISYGEKNKPQGLLSVIVTIPDRAVLEKIDVTDPENPEPIFIYPPDSDVSKLKIQITNLENQLTEAQLALTEQYELNLELDENITNTQLALVELYEGKEA